MAIKGQDMSEIPLSENSMKALAELVSALQVYSVLGKPNVVVSAIDALIENRITDAIEMMADRIQDATGVRP